MGGQFFVSPSFIFWLLVVLVIVVVVVYFNTCYNSHVAKIPTSCGAIVWATKKTKTKKDFEIDTKNQELGLFLFVYKKIFTFFGVTKLNIYLINTLNILYLLQKTGPNNFKDFLRVYTKQIQAFGNYELLNTNNNRFSSIWKTL